MDDAFVFMPENVFMSGISASLIAWYTESFLSFPGAIPFCEVIANTRPYEAIA